MVLRDDLNKLSLVLNMITERVAVTDLVQDSLNSDVIKTVRKVLLWNCDIVQLHSLKLGFKAKFCCKIVVLHGSTLSN